MSATFLQAAVILLREGLEAMLVIAALAAYLTKAGSSHRIHALYGGALAAVAASIVAAWLLATLNAGNHSDLVEACVILLAAALMLYVSGWMMVKQHPRDWQAYLARKADRALSQDSAFTVAALAFLAVFREGAETVLLVNALATTAGGWTAPLLSGLAAATAGLFVLFFLIKRVAQQIPLRALFVATSAFLFAMAIKFIGEAALEFQEQNLLGYTPVPGGEWLSAIGLNPTAEALGAQLVVIVLALASYLLVVQRNNRLARQSAAAALRASKS
ncbi:iron permease FTR1 [Rhodopseudomonas palustris BisB18]|uniref:Iron permease FTR1 n=2 Tax=Rhodopseudomonas palustris TaxID=1076 RepID=Q214E5_RHOPB